MSDSKCSRCGAPIVWHRSREGKPYPANSADRRDLHKCVGLFDGQNPQPAPVPKPITPSYDPPAAFDPEPSLEQRVADLETAVAQMAKTIVEIQGRQPITDQDLPDF